MKSRLDHLYNRHQGETAILIANGSSLNQMDLKFLKTNICIGMNKIYLGFKKFGFYPRYYVSVNRKVIEQSQQEINKINCIKFLGSQGAKNIISEDALTYIVDTENPHGRFCKDLTLGMHEGWTVTYAALQVAYYLGFHKVIIIGMDHNFIYSGKPNEAKIMTDADPNHFSDAYFGYGQTWDNPDLEKSEESYRIARQIYEADGRQIIDATVDGKCSIFSKVDYREIFGL